MKRLFFLLFALILAGAVIGNTGGSSEAGVAKINLFGTIYDTNHAVIAYAQVVAQGFDGKDYWATSNTEGAYKIELPSGRYKVEANSSGFCPRRVAIVGEGHSTMQRPLDFVLEIQLSDRPCKQKTMIKKEPRPTRKPELFRNIAE
jgi:hypothetical protein